MARHICRSDSSTFFSKCSTNRIGKQIGLCPQVYLDFNIMFYSSYTYKEKRKKKLSIISKLKTSKVGLFMSIDFPSVVSSVYYLLSVYKNICRDETKSHVILDFLLFFVSFVGSFVIFVIVYILLVSPSHIGNQVALFIFAY